MKRTTRKKANRTIRTAAAIVSLCVTMTLIGCASDKHNAQMAANPGVTDISIAPTPLAQPVPEPVLQPVVSDAPTQAAPVAAATPAPAGGKYLVQKGDTLWKIASTSYGDGKQWPRIANANPGVSPTSLKAGQTITIP